MGLVSAAVSGSCVEEPANLRCRWLTRVYNYLGLNHTRCYMFVTRTNEHVSDLWYRL